MVDVEEVERPVAAPTGPRRNRLADAAHAYERDHVAVATLESFLESFTGAPGTPR